MEQIKESQMLEDKLDKLQLMTKGCWNRLEDELIAEHVSEKGARDWSQLARRMSGRIGKQCRE